MRSDRASRAAQVAPGLLRPVVGAVVVLDGVIVGRGHNNPSMQEMILSIKADVEGGTALAETSADKENECEFYSADFTVTDIIWVIDESGSMSQEQQSMAANAVNFFNRAIAYGLDFRMGVTDVHIGNNGMFCTAQGQSNDFFLTPANLSRADLVLIVDLCFCEYTDHGHCGVLVDGDVDNDPTIENLARQAVSLAAAGADVIAPSDMMDGRIGAIRAALEENAHINTVILAYSAKFSSSFYGPFRDACGSAENRAGYTHLFKHKGARRS